MNYSIEDKYKSFIKVNFGPNWDNIAVTRRYIDEMVHNETRSLNAKLLSAAASELMENACKYSCYGGGYIAVYVFANAENLKIQVQNIASTDAILLLKERMAEISRGDPEDTYRKMMLQTFTQKSDKSRLGLAKIRYECKAEIQLKILNEIPDCLLGLGRLEELQEQDKTARAIEVSIVSALR